MHAQNEDRIAAPANGTRRRRLVLLALLGGAVLATIVLVFGNPLLRKAPTAPAAQQPAARDTAPSASGLAATDAHDGLTDTPGTAAAPLDTVQPPLPPLADSDAEVRSTLTALLPALLYPALAPTDLLARATSLLDGLAHGRLVRDKLPLPMPAGKTMVIERNDGLFLDPANYRRYDALAAALESVDAEVLADWYLHYEPLLQQAYAELGNGDARIREALLRGIDTALAAPIAPPEIALVQPSVFYRFADPALEALPASQKLLLRIGPDNREILGSWLLRFASRLR